MANGKLSTSSEPEGQANNFLGQQVFILLLLTLLQTHLAVLSTADGCISDSKWVGHFLEYCLKHKKICCKKKKASKAHLTRIHILGVKAVPLRKWLLGFQH